MKIHDVEQGSSDWWKLRGQMATASEFSKIITPGKGQLSAQAPKYLAKKLSEWMMAARGGSPEAVESFTNKWTQQGTDTEPEARAAYHIHTGHEATVVGFVERADGSCGGSPDALVGDEGGLELKCPALHTHIGYLLNHDTLVDTYKCQVHGMLWVTGRPWWDLVSYHREFPHVIVRIRIEPDSFTDNLGDAISDFAADLEDAKARLLKMGVEPLPGFEPTMSEEEALQTVF